MRVSACAGYPLRRIPRHALAGTTPTLAVNGLTAKTITKLGATALAASDLTTTAVACAVYDGTEFQLQNPQSGGGYATLGANTFTGVQTMPSIVLPGTSATNSASVGSELTSSGGCSGTGWTGTYPTYVPPGTTAPLTCTLTGGTVSGNVYQTLITITSYAAGSLTCTIGGAALPVFSANNSTVYTPKATGTGALICTPTSSFVTASVTVSAKLITPISTFTLTAQDSTAATSWLALLQQTATLNNAYLGGGGSYNTTGTANSAQGYQALYNNTTGSNNTAQGYRALYNNTTGIENTAQGVQRAVPATRLGSAAPRKGTRRCINNTTGGDNAAQGGSALSNNTTGSYNAAQGSSALYQQHDWELQRRARVPGAVQQHEWEHQRRARGQRAVLQHDWELQHRAKGQQLGTQLPLGTRMFLDRTMSSSAMTPAPIPQPN